MALKSFKMNKLIRDHIPSIMQVQGVMMHNTVMEDEDFVQKLKEKLLEESLEVEQSKTSEELAEELADVLEVVYALANTLGKSVNDIEEKRLEKRLKKGGFEKRLFNSHVDVDENNPAISYLRDVKKYPQINS